VELSYTLKIIEVRKETNDTVTIVFKQPGLRKVKYLPGQYLTLIFRINNRRYIRPYSLSSAPCVDSTLNVTVKKIPGGIISNHIVDQLKVDDLIEVIAPLGNFTLENSEVNDETSIVLWGAGSGITPLFSIAKHALANSIGKHVTMVYGNKNYESVIFLKEINQLKMFYPDRFSVWHFHTQSINVEEVNPYYVLGRIDPQIVISVLKKETDLNNTLHFICGPKGLKESVNDTLTTLGISSSKIFSEDFEIIKNPKDFEGIKTRTVNINFNEQNVAVEVVTGKSILEAGLDALLDLPYSCQTGTCLLCKGTKINGQIKLIGINKFPEELSQEECLLCCSYPLTDDISISVK